MNIKAAFIIQLFAQRAHCERIDYLVMLLAMKDRRARDTLVVIRTYFGVNAYSGKVPR